MIALISPASYFRRVAAARGSRAMTIRSSRYWASRFVDLARRQAQLGRRASNGRLSYAWTIENHVQLTRYATRR
ncbi:hypothetical protein N2601_28910 (plasmid) [Rhizobium sp. CB3060]|uniref:hypothetical protein n=1 Tax=Rhizobium sp. CB3060 TaxID=3138255 RepID=UPI0021A2813E|nr:hypothetical protein [Rhizobium tropici]UWU25399.1 hypothetical protein N2601_28910 [Rhizobium tropici]